MNNLPLHFHFHTPVVSTSLPLSALSFVVSLLCSYQYHHLCSYRHHNFAPERANQAYFKISVILLAIVILIAFLSHARSRSTSDASSLSITRASAIQIQLHHASLPWPREHSIQFRTRKVSRPFGNVPLLTVVVFDIFIIVGE